MTIGTSARFPFHCLYLIMLPTNYNCFNAKCFVFVASSLLMLALTLLAKPESPNFVVVYMDDLGWADTSVPMIEGREGNAQRLLSDAWSGAARA